MVQRPCSGLAFNLIWAPGAWHHKSSPGDPGEAVALGLPHGQPGQRQPAELGTTSCVASQDTKPAQTQTTALMATRDTGPSLLDTGAGATVQWGSL